MFNDQRMPAWYEIGTDKGNRLVLSVSASVLPTLTDLLIPTTPIVVALRKDLNLPKFVSLVQNKPWGFGGRCLPMMSRRPAWLSWYCTLPVIQAKNKNLEPSWSEAYVLSATLQVFFLALRLYEPKVDSTLVQLLRVEAFYTKVDAHGGSLTVSLSPAMVEWLQERCNEADLNQVVLVMRTAHEHMWQIDKRLFKTEFKARRQDPAYIHLEVRGNACSLDPNDVGEYHDTLPAQRPLKGYTLGPHNIDGPLQQLSFLMGLATMHRLAREATY